MKRIDQTQYLALLANAGVLERDRHGEKVLALPDGSLVKIFRRKRLVSTALFFPYARRFVANAHRLAGLGIPTVQVIDAAFCPAVARHLVTYQPLPGVTLRQALAATGAPCRALLTEFARLVATLHQKGIYFRSLHFGNVIVAPDGGLGLIDVADMNFRTGPLSPRQRLRNFRHMLRYREDRTVLRDFGWPDFIDTYLAVTGMSTRQVQQLHSRLTSLFQTATS